MDHNLLQSLGQGLYPTQSVHSKEIEAHFGSSLVRDLTDAELELLGKAHIYLVVFTNRCGSNYLVELLHLMHAGIRRRGEVFNAQRVIAETQRHGHATFVDYLLALVREHAQDGRVGYKISIHQLFWLTRLGLLEPFASVKLVNSKREDLLAQAVSHHKARSTGQWHSEMAAKNAAPVEYSRDKLLRSLFNIASARGLLDYYCAMHQLPRIDVTYEELVSDPMAQLQRLADFLAISTFAPETIDLSDVEIKQQRDEFNDRLRETFSREFAIGRDEL